MDICSENGWQVSKGNTPFLIKGGLLAAFLFTVCNVCDGQGCTNGANGQDVRL